MKLITGLPYSSGFVNPTTPVNCLNRGFFGDRAGVCNSSDTLRVSRATV